jgi:hypothetical protein
MWPDGDNDLFIELRRDKDDNGTPLCGYYLVNHSKRRIYWAEEVTLNHDLSNLLLQNVRGKISEHQAGELSVLIDVLPTSEPLY